MKIENIKKAVDICREIENRKRWIAEITDAAQIKSITYLSKSGRDISFCARGHRELFQIWTKLLVAELEMEIEQFHRAYYWLNKEELTTETPEDLT
ncbi:MAG: hypothetical protein SNI70_10775 [Rikenellaceae bacterium]